jgi:hypothetical protein
VQQRLQPATTSISTILCHEQQLWSLKLISKRDTKLLRGIDSVAICIANMLLVLVHRTGRELMWCRKRPSWWVILASHMANLRVSDQLEYHMRVLGSDMTITIPRMMTQSVVVAFPRIPAS